MTRDRGKTAIQCLAMEIASENEHAFVLGEAIMTRDRWKSVRSVKSAAIDGLLALYLLRPTLEPKWLEAKSRGELHRAVNITSRIAAGWHLGTNIAHGAFHL